MFLFLQLSCGGAYVSRVWTFGIGTLFTNFELTLLLVSEIPRHFCLQRTELRTRIEPVEILIGCFFFAVGDGASHVKVALTVLVAGDSSRRGLVQLPRQIHIPPRLLHYFSLERPSMLIGSGSCNAKSFGGSSDFHHHDSSHFHNKWRYRLYSYCSVNTYYWNPVDLMSSSCVNFATFLVSTERKCHICDIIVLNKSTLTQSQRISDLLYSRQQPDINCLCR